MIINENGIALIKLFEKCFLIAYLDMAGIWTIGWGHAGPEVHEGLVWTQQQADDALIADLLRFEQGVTRMLEHTLSGNQFSALVSLAFNIGLGSFGSSTVLHFINAGMLAQAPAAFMKWVKVTNPETKSLEVSQGLITRRTAEMRLFNLPDKPIENLSSNT